MSRELIDVLDENGEPTGKVMPREEVHKRGLWHGVIFVWIYNSRGHVLLQRRALGRKTFPGKWDISVGGHLLTGDTPAQAAVREVGEEVGLKITESDLIPVGFCTDIFEDVRGYTHRDYGWVFLLHKDVEVKDLSLQTEEVTDAQWVSIDDLVEIVADESKFAEYAHRTMHLYQIALQLRNDDQKAIWDRDHTNNKHGKWIHVTRQLADEIASEIPDGGKVLELGCGVGSDARFFADKGFEVVATDFSEVVLASNKQLGERSNLKFEFLDLSQPFPYADESFDVVYAYLSLHYFDDEVTQQVFQEITRVLKPEGRLYFTCKSVKDLKYGEGEAVGPDMFVRKGHFRHFFSEEYTRQKVEPYFKIIKLYESSFKIYDEESMFINCWAEKK